LLQDIERDKILQEDKANSSWWQERLQEISRLDSGARLDCIQHLHRNPRTEKGWLSLEVRLCRLHHILSEWIARDVDRDTDHVRDAYTVKIVRIVKGLYESKYLTPTVQGKLASVLVALGMEDSIRPAFPLADDRKLSFEFIKLIRSKSKKPLYKFMRIIEDPIQWQLRLFGDFLDRSMDSKPDPRVAFEPDAWQREVLDCLDKKESVLVVG
jgi:ATP-dependent RNA helicase DDX60